MGVALVVGRASGVDAAVLDDRIERRPMPQVERINRLDVVVRVDEHRRRALGVEPVGINDGVPAGWRRLHVLEADALEALYQEVGRGTGVGVVLTQGANARDAQELEELGQPFLVRCAR